jgi:uncharacterized surface protein with fasciclin (FAS1) repeats
MKHQTPGVILLVAAVFLSACGNSPEGSESAASETASASQPAGMAFVKDDGSAKNILQIAAGSADHSTLVAGVQAASLENVLANNGPLTVFAPNNAAFDKLPEGTLDDLLKPENKATLANIITFHAAPGNYTEEMLKDGMQLYMATGDYVKVEKKDGATFVNGAKILGSAKASNGMVHIVDMVMLPPEKK